MKLRRHDFQAYAGCAGFSRAAFCLSQHPGISGSYPAPGPFEITGGIPMNRISAASRWPSDSEDCLQRADTDLEFVEVMGRIGFDDPELLTIRARAFRMRIFAQDSIARADGGPRRAK